MTKNTFLNFKLYSLLILILFFSFNVQSNECQKFTTSHNFTLDAFPNQYLPPQAKLAMPKQVLTLREQRLVNALNFKSKSEATAIIVDSELVLSDFFNHLLHEMGYTIKILKASHAEDIQIFSVLIYFQILKELEQQDTKASQLLYDIDFTKEVLGRAPQEFIIKLIAENLMAIALTDTYIVKSKTSFYRRFKAWLRSI